MLGGRTNVGMVTRVFQCFRRQEEGSQGFAALVSSRLVIDSDVDGHLLYSFIAYLYGGTLARWMTPGLGFCRGLVGLGLEGNAFMVAKYGSSTKATAILTRHAT